MALTATATDVTRSTIFKVLNMVNPIMITHSPDKSNLFYIVLSTDELITQVFSPPTNIETGAYKSRSYYHILQ